MPPSAFLIRTEAADHVARCGVELHLRSVIEVVDDVTQLSVRRDVQPIETVRNSASVGRSALHNGRHGSARGGDRNGFGLLLTCEIEHPFIDIAELAFW